MRYVKISTTITHRTLRILSSSTNEKSDMEEIYLLNEFRKNRKVYCVSNFSSTVVTT